MVEGVINSFELGFRMQSALPAVLDLSRESKKTLEMYGINGKPKAAGGGKKAQANGGGGGTDNFGRQCLMARRLIEAGVRFVEVGHGGWDTHGGLKNRLTSLCGQIDQPIGALLTDLKQRGLLKDTLVDLGRRVRPDAEGPGHGRPQPQLGRLQHVAGRRPGSRAASASAPPTRRAAPRSRTRSTTTTCTPRCCTCSA